MARTISEIKKQLTDNFIQNETVIQWYKLDTAKTFEQQFSTASLENVLFFIFAVGCWVLENIFDTHVQEIDNMLNLREPHRRKWYQQKVLRFQYPNRTLVQDKDYYDNTGLTDDEIEALEVVKYCAVDDRISELLIKVAKGEPGEREPISTAEAEALAYYLNNDIKDAGVEIVIVNQQADRLFADIQIFYDPLQLVPSADPVRSALKNYISNLEFNGALSTTQLVDALQAVQGVRLVKLNYVNVQRSANPQEPLGVQKIADSGYWIVQNDADLIINYTLYTNENL